MENSVPKKQGKRWSDASILKAIPNPSKEGYEIKMKSSEITFLGVYNQPDYASVYLTFYPQDKVIELKSLKLYFQQFRSTVISYERLANVIFNDLVSIYAPARLRIIIETTSRGGISSKITIDSDWKVRGGKEKFKDWIGQSDKW